MLLLYVSMQGSRGKYRGDRSNVFVSVMAANRS